MTLRGLTFKCQFDAYRPCVEFLFYGPLEMARVGRPAGTPKSGGRRKGSRNKATADVKAAAQKYTTEALATLAEIMRKGESEPARVASAKELLDRGHGKSPQPQTGEGGEGPITVVVRRFFDDDE